VDVFFCPEDIARWGSTFRDIATRKTDLMNGNGQAETAYSYSSAYDGDPEGADYVGLNVPIRLDAAGSEGRCLVAGYVREDPIGMIFYPRLHQPGWVVG